MAFILMSLKGITLAILLTLLGLTFGKGIGGTLFSIILIFTISPIVILLSGLYGYKLYQNKTNLNLKMELLQFGVMFLVILFLLRNSLPRIF